MVKTCSISLQCSWLIAARLSREDLKKGMVKLEAAEVELSRLLISKRASSYTSHNANRAVTISDFHDTIIVAKRSHGNDFIAISEENNKRNMSVGGWRERESITNQNSMNVKRQSDELIQ